MPGIFILEMIGEIPTGKVTVDINGMWGKKMMTGILYGELKHELSLSDGPAGVYFIRIISGDKSETAKIIKQ